MSTHTPASDQLVELAQTSSTQESARRLFDEGAPNGVLVVAREQTAGRGRRGRTWLSGPHGLWLSMVLRGVLPMTRAPRLPLVAVDAVVGVLRQRGIDARVKWPNDVLLPDASARSSLGPYRKVGGLLLEVAQTTRTDDGTFMLTGAVLGLGLNLRPPEGGFPPALHASAGALADVDANFGVAGAAFDALRLDLARALGQALAGALPHAALDEAFPAILGRLRLHSATLGRRVQIDNVAGEAIDVDDDGALLVRDDAGVVHVLHAGDVAVVPPDDADGVAVPAVAGIPQPR
jgi:BirA family biotin operon repressor/biotin-[acetyl-CoA-carboxylase] ligase